MATKAKAAKLTIVLDDPGICRAITMMAAERGQPVPEFVATALREWFAWQEEQEDLAALEEARREAGDDPRIPWEQVKAELRALERAERGE